MPYLLSLNHAPLFPFAPLCGLTKPPPPLPGFHPKTKPSQYCTRVGEGPFPTELHDAQGEKLRCVVLCPATSLHTSLRAIHIHP